MGGTGDDYSAAMAVDSSGNVYKTGFFEKTAHFSTSNTMDLVSKGGLDIFVTKHGTDGLLAWVKQVGGKAEEMSFALALDAFNNVYLTGFYSDTVDFNPGSGTFPMSAASGTTFILKLDHQGDFTWARQFDSSKGMANILVLQQMPVVMFTLLVTFAVQ